MTTVTVEDGGTHLAVVTDKRKNCGTTFLWRLTNALRPYQAGGYKILYSQSGVAVVILKTAEALSQFVTDAKKEGILPTS